MHALTCIYPVLQHKSFFWNAHSFSQASGKGTTTSNKLINIPLDSAGTCNSHSLYLTPSVHDMHWVFTILIFFVQTQQLSINNKVSPSPDFPETELAPMEYHPEKAVDINKFGNSIFWIQHAKLCWLFTADQSILCSTGWLREICWQNQLSFKNCFIIFLKNSLQSCLMVRMSFHTRSCPLTGFFR